MHLFVAPSGNTTKGGSIAIRNFEVRMMSYRTLPPISGTYRSSLALPLSERRTAWSICDSNHITTTSQLNWNMFAGLALMAAISMGGWSGLALLVRYLFK
jgi:hypothetical protein